MALKPGVDDSMNRPGTCCSARLHRCSEPICCSTETSRRVLLVSTIHELDQRARNDLPSSAAPTPIGAIGPTLTSTNTLTSKQDLVETTLDALEKYVPNCREKIEHRGSRDTANVSSLHQASVGRQLWHQVRGACRLSRFAATNQRSLSRWLGWNHHVGLAWGNQLRRDRVQRSRPNALQIRSRDFRGLTPCLPLNHTTLRPHPLKSADLFQLVQA